jgi:hypothetical protein
LAAAAEPVVAVVAEPVAEALAAPDLVVPA